MRCSASIRAFSSAAPGTGKGRVDQQNGKEPATYEFVDVVIRMAGANLRCAFVNPESSIDVAPKDHPTSEPEPDIIVLKRELTHFPSHNPKPEDLHLVVEVADTSLSFDLTTKAELYARAGIVEYWVLDVTGRRLIVHREPKVSGYSSVIVYSEGESVSPLAASQKQFRVADALLPVQ